MGDSPRTRTIRSSGTRRWASNCRNNESSLLQFRPVRVRHDAHRLVPEDLIVLVLGESPMAPRDDLVIGAIDADPEGSDEHLPLPGLWLRDVDHAGSRFPAMDSDSAHVSHLCSDADSR